jgi:hypothetical protein
MQNQDTSGFTSKTDQELDAEVEKFIKELEDLFSQIDWEALAEDEKENKKDD